MDMDMGISPLLTSSTKCPMPDLALAILSNVNKVDMENNKQQHIEDGENIEDAEL